MIASKGTGQRMAVVRMDVSQFLDGRADDQPAEKKAGAVIDPSAPLRSNVRRAFVTRSHIAASSTATAQAILAHFEAERARLIQRGASGGGREREYSFGGARGNGNRRRLSPDAASDSAEGVEFGSDGGRGWDAGSNGSWSLDGPAGAPGTLLFSGGAGDGDAHMHRSGTGGRSAGHRRPQTASSARPSRPVAERASGSPQRASSAHAGRRGKGRPHSATAHAGFHAPYPHTDASLRSLGGTVRAPRGQQPPVREETPCSGGPAPVAAAVPARALTAPRGCIGSRTAGELVRGLASMCASSSACRRSAFACLSRWVSRVPDAADALARELDAAVRIAPLVACARVAADDPVLVGTGPETGPGRRPARGGARRGRIAARAGSARAAPAAGSLALLSAKDLCAMAAILAARGRAMLAPSDAAFVSSLAGMTGDPAPPAPSTLPPVEPTMARRIPPARPPAGLRADALKGSASLRVSYTAVDDIDDNELEEMSLAEDAVGRPPGSGLGPFAAIEVPLAPGEYEMRVVILAAGRPSGVEVNRDLGRRRGPSSPVVVAKRHGIHSDPAPLAPAALDLGLAVPTLHATYRDWGLRPTAEQMEAADAEVPVATRAMKPRARAANARTGGADAGRGGPGARPPPLRRTVDSPRAVPAPYRFRQEIRLVFQVGDAGCRFTVDAVEDRADVLVVQTEITRLSTFEDGWDEEGEQRTGEMAVRGSPPETPPWAVGATAALEAVPAEDDLYDPLSADHALVSARGPLYPRHRGAGSPDRAIAARSPSPPYSARGSPLRPASSAGHAVGSTGGRFVDVALVPRREPSPSPVAPHAGGGEGTDRRETPTPFSLRSMSVGDTFTDAAPPASGSTSFDDASSYASCTSYGSRGSGSLDLSGSHGSDRGSSSDEGSDPEAGTGRDGRTARATIRGERRRQHRRWHRSIASAVLAGRTANALDLAEHFRVGHGDDHSDPEAVPAEARAADDVLGTDARAADAADAVCAAAGRRLRRPLRKVEERHLSRIVARGTHLQTETTRSFVDAIVGSVTQSLMGPSWIDDVAAAEGSVKRRFRLR